MVVILPPFEQRGFIHLRLEVDGEPAKAGDAIGEADGEDDGLHALDGERLSDHGLGCVHQGDHAGVRLDVKQLGPGVVVAQTRQVALELLQILRDLKQILL